MTGRRDTQTVTPSGERLQALPDGVEVRDLITHADQRGTVCELMDQRWDICEEPIVFSYMFTIRPGFAKGWGVHRRHHDRYAFIGGTLEIVLHDGREQSPTAGLTATIVLSELHRRVLTIPPGVWHAENNIGERDVIVVNFPTIPYGHADPDKYRLPLDTDELPVEHTRGWRGW